MVGKRRLRISDETVDRLVVSNPVAQPCPLCGRPMLAGPTSDEHHLIPKSKGGQAKYRVHKICHQKIHATIDETSLARQYNTWDALKSHPEIEKFIAWVRSRPPNYVDKNRRLKK